MKIDVEHFGLYIYKQQLVRLTWNLQTPFESYSDWMLARGMNRNTFNYWTYYEKYNKETHKETPNGFCWHVRFCLHLKKNTKPLMMWGMDYKTEKTITKMIQVCENAGQALLSSKSNKKLPNAVKVMADLKMKFFGLKEVPIKYIDDIQFKKFDLYGTLNKTSFL